MEDHILNYLKDLPTFKNGDDFLNMSHWFKSKVLQCNYEEFNIAIFIFLSYPNLIIERRQDLLKE